MSRLSCPPCWSSGQPASQPWREGGEYVGTQFPRFHPAANEQNQLNAATNKHTICFWGIGDNKKYPNGVASFLRTTANGGFSIKCLYVIVGGGHRPPPPRPCVVTPGGGVSQVSHPSVPQSMSESVPWRG